MKSIQPVFCFCVLFYFTSIFVGNASEDSDPAINVKLAAYIWAKGNFGDQFDLEGNLVAKYTPPVVKYSNKNGDVVDMGVYPGQRTKFMNYQGPASIQFFKEMDVEGQDKPAQISVGQVTLPVLTRSALLLFYPKDQAMTSFHVYPLLNVSDVSFGKALVYNTCPYEILGKFGNEPNFSLQPQRSQLVNLKPDEFHSIVFQFAIQTKKGWYPIYNSSTSVHPQSSMIMIVHPQLNGDGTINRRLLDLLTMSAR
jgi:hypothetical protein